MMKRIVRVCYCTILVPFRALSLSSFAPAPLMELPRTVLVLYPRALAKRVPPSFSIGMASPQRGVIRRVSLPRTRRVPRHKYWAKDIQVPCDAMPSPPTHPSMHPFSAPSSQTREWWEDGRRAHSSSIRNGVLAWASLLLQHHHK